MPPFSRARPDSSNSTGRFLKHIELQTLVVLRRRRHRLRCRPQDARARPVRPSAIAGRYDWNDQYNHSPTDPRRAPAPEAPLYGPSSCSGSGGTACGADLRTHGLGPCVRLQSPADTTGMTNTTTLLQTLVVLRLRRHRSTGPRRVPAPEAPLAVPTSGRTG